MSERKRTSEMTPTDPNQTLRVAVIHERAILRRGLAGALAEHGLLLVDHEAGSAGDYAAQAERHPVVFASLSQGQALLRHWGTAAGAGRAQAPAVVIVDADLGELDVHDALRSGARGLLELDASSEELVDCARTLAAGGRYVARPLAAALAQQVYAQALTSREEEVLRLIDMGCCNKVIARELGIALGTVKTHVKAILSKLEASSRTEAVAVAKRRGLVRSGSRAEAAPAHGTGATPGRALHGSGAPQAKMACSPLRAWADSYQFSTAS